MGRNTQFRPKAISFFYPKYNIWNFPIFLEFPVTEKKLPSECHFNLIDTLRFLFCYRILPSHLEYGPPQRGFYSEIQLHISINIEELHVPFFLLSLRCPLFQFISLSLAASVPLSLTAPSSNSCSRDGDFILTFPSPLRLHTPLSFPFLSPNVPLRPNKTDWMLDPKGSTPLNLGNVIWSSD